MGFNNLNSKTFFALLSKILLLFEATVGSLSPRKNHTAKKKKKKEERKKEM